MTPKATNNFVLLIRDEIEKNKNGLIIPTAGRVKPSQGTIFSVGSLVKDRDIKSAKGKKCLFHPTVGFAISYEDVEYWVLIGEEIITLV